MRGRRRTLRPVVEPIESRALLSGGLAGASATRAMVRHHDPAAIHLNGTLRGQYLTNSPGPDAGTTYLLNGVDPIRGFGLASGLGDVSSPGFVASGYAQGDLALLGLDGTLRIHLTALEPQTGFQNLPADYSFNITGGTGRFRGAQGVGSATLRLIQGPRSTFGFPRILQRFTLTLTSQAVAT